MRVKSLAQGENILMLGFEPSTFCIQNRHSNHYTNCSGFIPRQCMLITVKMVSTTTNTVVYQNQVNKYMHMYVYISIYVYIISRRSLPGLVCLFGDMNIHFDNPLQSLTKQTLSTLSLYGLVQVINKPTHRCGHIIDWVIVRPDDDIHRKSTVTDSLESDHYCTKSYFNIQSLSLLPYTGLLGTLLTLTAHHLLLNFPVFQSFHLLKMQTSSVTFCVLY